MKAGGVVRCAASRFREWPDTPNEEARVSGHFTFHLEWPNTQQGSERQAFSGGVWPFQFWGEMARYPHEIARHVCPCFKSDLATHGGNGLRVVV